MIPLRSRVAAAVLFAFGSFPVLPAAAQDGGYLVGPGDVLNLRACCDDGQPLPHWVRFDVRQRAFTGTAPHTVEVSDLRIVVIASDVDGLEARSTFFVRRVIS